MLTLSGLSSWVSFIISYLLDDKKGLNGKILYGFVWLNLKIEKERDREQIK